jgi:transposase
MARKVSRLLATGASKAEAAADCGVTEKTIDGWLALLNCDAKVIEAVERGEVAATVARKLVKLESRAEQRRVLGELLAKGTSKGATAAEAVKRARQTGEVVPFARMLPPGFLRKWAAAIGRASAQVELETVLAFVLGDRKAYGRLPELARSAANAAGWK